VALLKLDAETTAEVDSGLSRGECCGVHFAAAGPVIRRALWRRSDAVIAKVSAQNGFARRGEHGDRLRTQR